MSEVSGGKKREVEGRRKGKKEEEMGGGGGTRTGTLMLQRVEEVIGSEVWENEEESMGRNTLKDMMCTVFVYVMAIITASIHVLRLLLLQWPNADRAQKKRTRITHEEEASRAHGKKSRHVRTIRRDTNGSGSDNMNTNRDDDDDDDDDDHDDDDRSTASGLQDIIRVIFKLNETQLVREGDDDVEEVEEEEEEDDDDGDGHENVNQQQQEEEDEAAAEEEMLGQGRGREIGSNKVAALTVEQCVHLLKELELELTRRGARIAELEETEEKNLQMVEKGIRAMKDAYGASLEEFERELVEAESRWTRTFDEMEELGRERVAMLSKELDRATVEAETKDRLVDALREDMRRVEAELEESKRDLRVSALGISESARLVAGLRVRVEDAEIIKKSAQMTLEVVSRRCAEIGKERNDLRSSVVLLSTRITDLESASLSLSHNASHALSRIERERELLDMQRREQEYRTPSPQRNGGRHENAVKEYASSSVGTGGDDNGGSAISAIVVSHEKAMGAAHAALVSELKSQLADQKRIMDEADADFRTREAELRARLRQAWTDEEEMRIERDAAVEAMAAESKKDEAIRIAMASSSLSTSPPSPLCMTEKHGADFDLDYDIDDLPTPLLNLPPSPMTSPVRSGSASPPPDLYDRVRAFLRLTIFAIFVSLLAMVTRLFSVGR